jgi:hypothetical protein
LRGIRKSDTVWTGLKDGGQQTVQAGRGNGGRRMEGVKDALGDRGGEEIQWKDTGEWLMGISDVIGVKKPTSTYSRYDMSSLNDARS